ncbi:glutamate mutase L [Dactylosporangium sp. AC04546]|uniref:glutamate mutase L n=1 Tax=Dactylosporangium sp. AC04546 TaxID=2862460 RepID=UPI001EDD228F|nr:glutamate mutase L [Dactylosporangium sp. AC04546]WVK89381.1 glutamate mutase L [Dactylosporangium sp. AC04546]
MTLVACLDVGSTDTKLAVVDVGDGTLVASATHPTTAATDVLDGVDALLAGCGPVQRVYCCSSAGGGLRLAVIGQEALVSADAAHRVALSAGARVVHVAAGRQTPDGLRTVRAARPDVLLLVGGTDGGDPDTLLHNARRLAAARWRVPVVVAGNADARDEVTDLLTARGLPVAATGNVLPRIGVLDPVPARTAIRDVFLRHVIGGKRLSRGTRFARMVSAATPDAVLTGVGLYADQLSGDLLVVDVGGATTDVYSALVPDETSGTAVAGTLWRSRTVEGDLGVRWNVDGILAAATTEKISGAEHPLGLATVACTVAVRRHARAGRDLRNVVSVVASGGVFRHAEPRAAAAALTPTLHDHAGGWALPRAPHVAVDRDYVLAPAGLLAADHPDAAAALLRRHLHGP